MTNEADDDQDWGRTTAGISEADPLRRRSLDVWIDHRALLALARLANHHGVSKAQMIERLATQADDATLKTLSDDEFDRYLGSVT